MEVFGNQLEMNGVFMPKAFLEITCRLALLVHRGACFDAVIELGARKINKYGFNNVFLHGLTLNKFVT